MFENTPGGIGVQSEEGCFYKVGEKCLYWLEKYGQYQHEQAIEEGWLDKEEKLTQDGLDAIDNESLQLKKRIELVEALKSGAGAGREKKRRLKSSISSRRTIFGREANHQLPVSFQQKGVPSSDQKSVSSSDKDSAQQSVSSMLRKLKKIRQAFIKEVKKMIRPVGGGFLNFKEEKSQDRLRVRMPDGKGRTTIYALKGTKDQIRKALADLVERVGISV